MIRVTRSILIFMFMILLWHVLVVLTKLPPFILPGPMRVAAALFGNIELIWAHAMVTIAEVLLGLGLGSLLGAMTAIGLAISPMARTMLRPMMVISQALPVFALAPLLTLWLGYGLWPKVIMALLIIYLSLISTVDHLIVQE